MTMMSIPCWSIVSSMCTAVPGVDLRRLLLIAIVATAAAVAEPVLRTWEESDQGFVARRAELPWPKPPVDEPLLAIQIGGIAGAYVISVAICLSLLLIVGRRLRRQVESSNYTLQVEMVTLAKPPFSMDPSPITPISANLPSLTRGNAFAMSWSSVTKGHRHQASGNTSVVTVDESVIASDRRRAQEEMEMLYAAVMEHDAQRAIGFTDATQGFQTSSRASARVDSQGSLPARQEGHPASHLSPPTSPRTASRLSKLSPLSLFSSNTRGSTGSSGKLRSPRLSARKLPISPPIRSPDITAPASYGDDQVPLTPRHYNPGPPPSAPPMQARHGKVSFSSSSGRAPAPAPLNMTSAAHSSSSLPFRDAYPLQSAPATKTTILDRPDHLRNGLRTGVATPYSPYMPFTPVTPITPSRFVTKRERKREGKENGLRVLREDDMVKSDDEMWGA